MMHMEAEEWSTMTPRDQQESLLTSLSEEQRALAMERFAMVRLVVEESLPQAQVAREQHIPLRSLQRWIALYRKRGLVGLARSIRIDRGTHRHLSTTHESRRMHEPSCDIISRFYHPFV